MTVPLLVSEQAVRDILNLNVDATSRYNNDTIGSNIRTSLEFLEQAANRYFYDRPGNTLTLTTNGQAAVALPGFRTISSVTWMDTPLDVNQTYWTYPDELQTGLIVAVSVRPFVQRPGAPNWLASPQWFDRGLDLHRYPSDWGTGPWDQGSLTGDLVVVGDGGYAAGSYPDALLSAVKAGAAIETLAPGGLLSGAVLSADGNQVDLTNYMLSVKGFVRLWRTGGTQAVSL